MGFGRAGYYGYDIMEGIGSPGNTDSADHILPEFQHFKVGDLVPISLASTEVFYAIQPNLYLIWAGQTGPNPGGFTWALYPVDESHTRLVSRIRWSYHALSQPGLFSLDLLTEFTDHLAVRKILQGVKGRVEGHVESPAVTNLEFLTYLVTALVFAVALILNLIRPLSGKGWLAGLVAGAGWLITWYAPIPFWAGALLELLGLAGLYLAASYLHRHATGQVTPNRLTSTSG
jgi:hypothetical protein